MDTGAPVTDVRERLLFASAYLGAGPIAHALGQGADIVLTGRVADAALSLGPIVHELGWRWDDWDRLALGLDCRSPAGMLGAGLGRQLRLRRRVGAHSGSAAHRLSDRRGARRRLGDDHQGAGDRRARIVRHRPPATPLRSAQPARVRLARRRAGHGRHPARGAWRRRCRGARRRGRAAAGEAQGGGRLRRRLDGLAADRLLLAGCLPEVPGHRGAGPQAHAGGGHPLR